MKEGKERQWNGGGERRREGKREEEGSGSKKREERELVPTEMRAGHSLFKKLDGETKSGCAFLELVISHLQAPWQMKELGCLCWKFQPPK